MDSERKKKLEATLKELNKGKDSTANFDYAEKSPDKEVIPFGIPAIDEFYGGGVPMRKYTVDFGGEDTGKSTRALHLVAAAQKQNLICCYLDMERKFDKDRAKSIGVNLEDLILSQTIKTAEEAMDAIKKLAEEKVVDLIVVDSIQAMSPKGEQETKKGKKKSIENDEMALLARKLGKFFRVTSADVFNAKMAVYLIGQVRQNLGGFFSFADLSGGNALKHWMSICTFSRKGQKTDAPFKKYIRKVETPDGKIHKKTEKKILGFDCVLKMVKSHLCDSARENENIHLPFYFETGFKKPQEKSKVIEIVKDEIEKLTDKPEKELIKPLTRDYKETIEKRKNRDPEFKKLVEQDKTIPVPTKKERIVRANSENAYLTKEETKNVLGFDPKNKIKLKKFTKELDNAMNQCTEEREAEWNKNVNKKDISNKKKRGRGRPKKGE